MTPGAGRRPVRRTLAGTAPLLLAAVVGLPLASPAQAAPGRCDPGTGVTVVVDFDSLGRGVELGCDPSGAGAPASRVVPRAGFPLTYLTNGQPFVCRIGGLPGASDEACHTTPPEDAYWALYWSDGRNGRWVYSSEGVATLDVPAGGSIGFRWQDGKARLAPSAPPNTGAPPKPEPTKSPEPAPKPTVAPATPTERAGSPSASTSPAGTPSASPTATKKAERQEKGADERSDTGERAGKRGDRKAAAEAERRAERRADSRADDEQVTSEAVVQEETPLAPASATDDSGGALTWVAGGAVLLLAAAAGVLARRRRG